MSDTPGWQLPSTLADNQTVHAPIWVRLFRSADFQTVGALNALGSGVIDGFAVTAGSGPSVSIAAGEAIASHHTYGSIYLHVLGATPISGLADGDTWIFVKPKIATTIGNLDSREGDTPLFPTQTTGTGGDTLADALPLAKVTCVGGALTTIVDLRTYYTIAALQQAVTAIQAAITAIEAEIGAGYDPVALGTIKDRLAALESGGGGGGSGTTFWGLLAKSFGDATTIDQAIAAAIAAYATANPPSAGAALVVSETRDEIAVNDLNNAYLHEVAHDNAFDIAPLFRAIVVSPGRGHNKQPDVASLIDYANTTVVIDEVNNTFG